MSTPEEPQDLTRKQRREAARTERKAVEEAHAAADARRRRLTIVGVIIAVVVIAVVAIVIFTNKNESHTPTSAKETSKVQGEVNELLKGTTQNANVLGDPNAPVTIQYFGDLECPICRDFTLGALPEIIQRWVAAGKVKVEYRSLSTATGNAESSGAEPSGTFKTQQSAALAAGKQNKMWNYIETFYREQGEEDSGYVTESYLQGLAQQVPGLNLSQWSTDRGQQTLLAQLASDTQEANNRNFTGTPSFLIGKTGGAMKKFEYTSLQDPTSFNEAIEALLKG